MELDLLIASKFINELNWNIIPVISDSQKNNAIKRRDINASVEDISGILKITIRK